MGGMRLFLFLYSQDFAAFIGAAFGAGVMRQLAFMAAGTLGE
jgi:hypothetical protein